MYRLIPLLLSLLASLAQAQELLLRHRLEGETLGALGALVVQFNGEQKGKGNIRLESLPGPDQRVRLPAMALLDLTESMEFFGTLPRFMPLHELMRVGGQKFDNKSFFPQIADAVDDGNGRLQSLPLALGLPVLYLNRPMLKGAGVDLEKPPRTWWELQTVAGQLYDSGVKFPLTSSDFAWVHLENLASQHDQPMTLKQKSVERLLINSMVHVKHLALLASWQKSRYFHYSGGSREGDQRFLAGECAMLTGDSSLFMEARRRGLDVAIHALPHYDDVYGVKPADILPDGAGLWVLAGLKKEETRLAARFATFLMRPDVQRQWVAKTSFLPMSPAAIGALREARIFPETMLDAAAKRLSMPTKNSTRPRAGAARERLRTIFGEEVQMVWNSDRAPKEALDVTVQRANALAAPLIAPARTR